MSIQRTNASSTPSLPPALAYPSLPPAPAYPSLSPGLAYPSLPPAPAYSSLRPGSSLAEIQRFEMSDTSSDSSSDFLARVPALSNGRRGSKPPKVQDLVENLEEHMESLRAIDISDPNSYDVISPSSLINSYEDDYGDVSVKILEPGELTSTHPSDIDVSSRAIVLGKNTLLDFVALDPGMAFLLSNGTSVENLIIAENMSETKGHHPVLLSFNGNDKQNIDMLTSPNIDTITLDIDLPIGLNSTQVSNLVATITHNTETLEIVSPDMVAESLPEDSRRMMAAGFFTKAMNFVHVHLLGPTRNFKNIFGKDIQPHEILPELIKPSKAFHRMMSSLPGIPPVDGIFQIVMHGALIGNEYIDVDCTDFARLAFVGRFGLNIGMVQTPIGGEVEFESNWANSPNGMRVGFQTVAKRAVGDVCRMPRIRLYPSPHNKAYPSDGIQVMDKPGNLRIGLTNNDLIDIFGEKSPYEGIELPLILNLLRMSYKGKEMNAEVFACLGASERLKSKPLTDFRVGTNDFDIPQNFINYPTILDPLAVERRSGPAAPDAVCRFGNLHPNAAAECSALRASERKPVKIDPNRGISGDGIRAALADVDMRRDVRVQFKIDNKEMYIPAVIYVHLKKWHDDHSAAVPSRALLDTLFSGTPIGDLRPYIKSIVQLGSELTYVFNEMIKEGIDITTDTIPWKNFKTRLVQRIVDTRDTIKARLT